MQSEKLKNKIGFACGVFDLFHAGHVLMLKECKENCDYLLIAVNRAENINPKINPNKKVPIYSLQERKLILNSCKYIDEVIDYNSEKDLIEILNQRNIDIRFLGDDYKSKPITEGNNKIPIYYINRDHGLSTSKIRKSI